MFNTIEEAKRDPVFSRVMRLCDKHKMRWFFGSWPEFDRKKGYAADDTSELCHELAHWLVSPKRLRGKENFGLGHPGNFDEDDPTLRVSYQYARRLEEEASMLGIILLYECGCPLNESFDVACDHSWTVEDVDHDIVMSRLAKKDLWSPKRTKAWTSIMAVGNES